MYPTVLRCGIKSQPCKIQFQCLHSSAPGPLHPRQAWDVQRDCNRYPSPQACGQHRQRIVHPDQWRQCGCGNSPLAAAQNPPQSNPCMIISWEIYTRNIKKAGTHQGFGFAGLTIYEITFNRRRLGLLYRCWAYVPPLPQSGDVVPVWQKSWYRIHRRSGAGIA